jgi:1,4-dihydroxy-2-naphthoyl-CoA synthase
MPAHRTLLVALDRGVATITLNRPQQRNAIGDRRRDELADGYRRIDSPAGPALRATRQPSLVAENPEFRFADPGTQKIWQKATNGH